jgi:hypothetical protein
VADLLRRLIPALLLALTCLAGPAFAAPPVPVTFGKTWDSPSLSLQNIVDAYLGGPGLINVTTDYLGASATDLDPFFWVDSEFPALLVREVAGYQNTNILGWYKETFSPPVIDGVDDGVVFTGPMGSGSSTIVTFPGGVQFFGFYLNPNGTGNSQNAPEPEKFFTNRFYNDIGPSGSGALHPPLDGDVQALVFDVAPWKGANTFLICFEDLDSGAAVGPCCTGTDNDFNDLVFEIKAFGATPTTKLSFGGLKAKYLR